jgi:putative cell wall-binding protein
MTEGKMAELQQKIRATPAMPPTVNEEVRRSVNVAKDTFSYETNSLKDIFAEIDKDIVKSILESNVNDLDVTFNRYLSSFKPKFEKVNKTMMIMLEKGSQPRTNNIELAKRIAKLEYQMYEGLKQYIQTRKDLSHNVSSPNNPVSVLIILKSYG